MIRNDIFHIIEYDDEHQSKWSTFYDILMLEELREEKKRKENHDIR
jgi:hypothetical protein